METTDEQTVDVFLAWARQFFHDRDAMNASVHLSGIRLSPITALADSAIAAFTRITEKAKTDEAPHVQ